MGVALLIVFDDPGSDDWLKKDALRSSYGESNDACGGVESRGETLGGVGALGIPPNIS